LVIGHSTSGTYTMPADQRTSSTRRWIVWTLRIGVLVVVGVAVSGTVRNAWAEISEQDWHVWPAWLVASGILYLIGLVPMAWFWQRTLAALGCPTPWGPTLRAYFLGHVGKYVPGKAMAVALRVVAIRKWAPSIRIAILSTMLETLTMMAVGAFLGAGLSAYLLRSRPELALAALATAVAVGLPTLPPVARWLARFGAERMKVKAEAAAARGGASTAAQSALVDIDSNLNGISWRLLVDGWFAAIVCWLFLALSLWATLRAIGVDDVNFVDTLPRLVAAVAMAIVAGFVSMLPGGLGVRDLALVELLDPICGSANALVAAILMRLVWLVSELAACVILYVAARRRSKRLNHEAE
jgi:uncharacterized membrane protein YbhN (UPF0104 family)